MTKEEADKLLRCINGWADELSTQSNALLGKTWIKRSPFLVRVSTLIHEMTDKD